MINKIKMLLGIMLVTGIFFSFSAWSVTFEYLVARDGTGDFTDIQSALDHVATMPDKLPVLSVGTVSVAKGDIHVTGVGTYFNFADSDFVIKLGTSNWNYPIHSVSSNTSLELLTGTYDQDMIDVPYELSWMVQYVIHIKAGTYQLVDPLIIPDGYDITLQGTGLDSQDTNIFGIYGDFVSIDPYDRSGSDDGVLSIPRLVAFGMQGKVTLKDLSLRMLSKNLINPFVTSIPGILICNTCPPTGTRGQNAVSILRMENIILKTEIIGDLVNGAASSLEIINSKFFNTTDSFMFRADNLLIDSSEFKYYTVGKNIFRIRFEGENQIHRPWIIRNSSFSAVPGRIITEEPVVSFGRDSNEGATGIQKVVTVDNVQNVGYNVGHIPPTLLTNKEPVGNDFDVNYLNSSGDVTNYCSDITVSPLGSMAVTNVTTLPLDDRPACLP